jgi:hypothetical protein
MQLATNDGISCDLCGTEYRTDFGYYSFDIRKLQTVADRRMPLQRIFHEPIAASIDVCGLCFGHIQEQIIANNAKLISDKRRVVKTTMCDMSGATLQGTYTYFHVNVVKVDVKMRGQNPVCAKCQTATTGKTCPKCQSTEVIVPASVTTVDRFVELYVSQLIFDAWQARIIELRNKPSEWTGK